MAYGYFSTGSVSPSPSTSVSPSTYDRDYDYDYAKCKVCKNEDSLNKDTKMCGSCHVKEMSRREKISIEKKRSIIPEEEILTNLLNDLGDVLV